MVYASHWRNNGKNNRKIRGNNMKTIEELKKLQKTTWRCSLSLAIGILFFLGVFLFTWMTGYQTMIAFVAAILSIILTVLFGVFILECNLISVFIYLRELTLETKE
jgi:sterol desaturase/sphingolipid hydroxylase (fatty acid hydroxylase superfamily)